MLKDQLQRGLSVQIQATDDSLFPKVCSGDTCHFEPVRALMNTLREGDIIFCQNKEDGEFHLTKIWHVRWDPPPASAPYTPFKRRFVFGNSDNTGRSDGYAPDGHVYGRLVRVDEVK